jgi:hypothetical protein
MKNFIVTGLLFLGIGIVRLQQNLLCTRSLLTMTSSLMTNYSASG